MGSQHYRYASLRTVFDPNTEELSACMARVSVLYEDLFLELSEASPPEAKTARRIYFIRRSFGTLREFVEALRWLDGLGDFAPIKKRFKAHHLVEWEASIAYLKEQKKKFYDLRNIFGGHFSHDAALHFVRNSGNEGQWPLETHFNDDNSSGPRLYFAEAIAASSMLRYKPEGVKDKDYAAELFQAALRGYEASTFCVQMVTLYYLGERFGFRFHGAT